MKPFTAIADAIGRLFGRSAPSRPRYRYPCPVCNLMYDRWTEPREQLRFSYDICPCCYTEFGYDDFSKSHEELKWEWIENGAEWHGGDIEPAPPGWDWRKQISTIYMSDRDFAAFVAACEDDDAEPNEKLKEAARNFMVNHGDNAGTQL